MVDLTQDDYLTSATGSIAVDDSVMEELTVKEFYMTESLLTPGLQTMLLCQSRYATPSMKNLDQFYGKFVNVEAVRPIISTLGMGKDNFSTSQLIYRLSDRKKLSYEVEEFTLHACDPSLIQDAMDYVSRSWGCSPPHEVVKSMLVDCLSSDSNNVEDAGPPRDYHAENIHPFQVINQQSESALSLTDSDPSFVHFMTYQNDGGDDVPTHNWRSLATMCKQDPIMTFKYSHKVSLEQNYMDPTDIMDYSFPCDFDLLSDVLNGYDDNGKEMSSLIVFNKLTGGVSHYGELGDCGATPYSAATNLGSAELQDSCNTNIEQYLLKRRARMALLDQDKIALRLTVPFNPQLNAGRVIEVKFLNPENQEENYGSGKYLIVNMTHNIKLGGLGITVLDCISNTIGASNRSQ